MKDSLVKSRHYLLRILPGFNKRLFTFCSEITPTFAEVYSINCPLQIIEFDFYALEQFVVSLCISINACEVSVA